MNRRTVALTAAALWITSPAWADITATTAMTQSQTLNLDTGALAVGVDAGDLLYTGWNGALHPLSGTQLALVEGVVTYANLTQANLVDITTYHSNPLPDALLRTGTIIAVRTKTGKYSKILVQQNTTGILVFTFTTFTANPLAPTIRSVQNNYGQIPAGLPNSALAPGSLIFIKGTNLSRVNDGQTLRSSAAPGLQNTVGGVSVTVTVNGVSLNCPLYYLSPTQINAVLPGGTPLGRGTLFVTDNQDRSATVNITVAQSAFGIVHYNNTLAATYDANNALITSFNAANPGQTIVIWGSGVGADADNDDRLFPQKTNDLVNVPMQVLVGGRVATLRYHGRSQFPGVDQVVVTLPPNVPTGCYVPLQVITGDIVSNGVTIPVAAGSKTCSDADDSLTPALIRTLSAKPTVRMGTILMSRLSSSSGPTTLQADGEFKSTTGFGLTAGDGSVSTGNCLSTVGGRSSPLQISTPIDAGARIQVSQFIGTPTSVNLAKKTRVDATAYLAATIPETLFPAAGVNLSLESFEGGTDVSRISTVVPLPTNFSWTNSPALATVDRQGATVTWSGGSNAAFVIVNGSASSAETGAIAEFICRAPASAGRFTIPASTLMAMPARQGDLVVFAVGEQDFHGLAGLDFALFSTFIGSARSARY